MLRRDMKVIGSTTVTEYGIYDIRTRNWLGFSPDGGLKRLSDEAIRLLPEKREPVTEAEAGKVLAWALERAGKTADENGRWVSISHDDLQFCAVFGFETTEDLTVETGVEIESLRSADILFNVRGVDGAVDDWVKNYIQAFPAELYKTSVHPGHSSTSEKSVRIFRRKSPFIE